ncbi:MAG: 30S ribosomal protein S16 [Patescibacteria group bacterium]
MLKIKLARFGKRHQPHFRFVITEARDKRDGQYVVSLGYYAPTSEPKLLELDLKAYDEWLKKGAQPTETVASLAERVRTGKTHTKRKKLSKKAAAKLAKPAEPVVEVAKEAPTEPVAPAAVEETKVEAETVTPTV